MIDPELAAFLQQGLGLHIGARDDHLQPEGARAIALRVAEDGVQVAIYVAEIAAARILPLLRANGQVAITCARPVDDRACQVKGTFVDARPAEEDERQAIDQQWNRFLGQLEQIGIPRATTAGWTTWPAVAIRLRVTAVFDQTPGSKAGTVLA
jgi:hypothetical protein